MKLVEILLMVRSVSKEYHTTHADSYPIDLLENGMKGIIEKQTGQEISITCLPWPGSMFAARLDRYESISNIWYSNQLNSCWSRFYIAKELVHILCGDERNFTKNPIRLIDSIINSDILALEADMDDCMMEFQVRNVAISLLLPQHLSKKLYELAATKTNREIAGAFKVPEKLIEFRLSEAGRELFNSFENNVY